MPEQIKKERETSEVGLPCFLKNLNRLKKKVGTASCMILIEVIDSKEDERGKCYHANASGERVLYDDEPRNTKELLAHPERDVIKKAGDAEIQQLIHQKIGVILPKLEVDEVLKNGGKVLNTKMLFKRKYEIVDGVERFKKWKGKNQGSVWRATI